MDDRPHKAHRPSQSGAKAEKKKGKGKEKDVGKRRAYVQIVTTLGAGSLNVELFCEKVRGAHLWSKVF